MKIKTLLLLLAIALVLAATALPARSLAAPAARPKVVNVDYVLALIDAGIEDREIIKRIEERNLTFNLASGDLDRLREAGAGEDLIDVVAGEAAKGDWQRPNRIEGYQPDANGEGIEEMPYDDYGYYYSSPSYGYYAPGYSSFYFSYGYPYGYSYPNYYSPYRYHLYYSSPHYYGYRNHSYRTVPRGGSYRGAPRGSWHGGGGTHRTSPRGGGHHH